MIRAGGHTMKNVSRFSVRLVAAMLLSLGFGSFALAAGEEGQAEPKYIDWSFSGIFGTYDEHQLQRGFQIFREVCSSCHSANLIAFRNLSEHGGPAYSEEQVKALAAEYRIMDPEAAEGERAAITADRWPAPFTSEREAREANGGALPPDFSVLAKARGMGKPFPGWLFNYFTAYQEGGADYVYNLLTNYHDEAPAGTEIPEGKYYNAFFHGNAIAMAPPLSDGAIAYEEPGVPQTVDQYAEDVSAFMMWMADPHMVSRKEAGFRALIFLILLSGLLYLTKRKLWANIAH